MAGMKLGRDDGLAEYDKARLYRLWREVRQVTGQVFAERLPEPFVFDSELACRAVEVARQQCGEPPWEFFYALQSAFFVDCKPTNDIHILSALLGLSPDDTRTALADPVIGEIVAGNRQLVAQLSAHALPNVQLDLGEGYSLVSGGFISADFLVPDLRQRIASAAER